VAEYCDALIIGTGQAGPSLAARLSGAGMKVVIAERKKFGGTCVNTGCIPTKTLVASAYAIHLARRGSEYGFSIADEIRVDMKRVKARKDEVAGRSNKGVETWLKGLQNCTVVEGHARFESANTVQVNDRVFEAAKIFINGGGRASVPTILGLDQISYLTNSSIMDVDFLPEHLVILGGSYIGLEFGQMYRRFGSRVTIIEAMPRVIAREDEDISQAVEEILKNEAIDICVNSKLLRVEKNGDRVALDIEHDGASRRIEGSHLLVAVGRVPNTQDLGLDQAGVKTDSRGYIIVDDQLRTNQAHIWALGDCNGRGAFTHTSYNDYEIVADNLLNGEARRVSDRIQTYALFTDPPLGRCGMTTSEIQQSGRKALFAKFPMSRVSRAIEKSETQGVIKLAVDAESKQFLGAAILGTGGDEIIHVILDAMYAKAPYTVIQRAMHIHPTVTEFLPTILGQLQPARV
jgi:pyruvate/2-oxoglutarate dehydrogenase complex dihydrolipoamide dehydrogenase (E3) component